MRGQPVERYLRDAKLYQIGEGTSQINRLVIACEIRAGTRERCENAVLFGRFMLGRLRLENRLVVPEDTRRRTHALRKRVWSP